MNPFFWLFAVEQSFDVEVGTPCVLMHGGAHLLALTGNDHVWIRAWKRAQESANIIY